MSTLAETEFAKTLITQLSRRLHRRRAVPGWNREDYSQELWLRLLEVQRRFEARRGKPEGFITVVLRRRVHELTRQRHDPECSLETVAPMLASETHETFAEVALRQDVAQVLQSVSAELQALAEQLKRHRLAEVARQQKVPRSTLQNRVRKLRDAFEKHQLRGS